MIEEKYFLLYADGKRVQQISREKFNRMYGHTSLLVANHETALSFVKGENFIWLAKKQLRQVLEEIGWIKKETEQK